MSQAQLKTEAPNRASFFDLYRFASKSECVLIVSGVILTAIAGIAVPLFILISADVFDSMADAHEETVSDAWIRNKIARGYSRSEVKELEAEQTNSDNSYYYDVTDTVQVMLIIGAMCFLACWAGLVLFVRVGLAQANYYRRAYLSALLKKPISYYEYNLPGSVCSSIDTECTRIEVATGEKLFVFIYTCLFVIFGLGFACYAQMQLTLICLLQLPIGAFGASINVKGIALQAQLKAEVNKKSGGFLEECLIVQPAAVLRRPLHAQLLSPH
jgi:ATP-binding cassette subfamily B (MDR/TAP) protein 1